MARNICIFSDGTGQAGGANPINWTNVYRLFKATREIAPQRARSASTIPVSAPIPTARSPAGANGCSTSYSQATGYGITTNIIDCYAAVLLSYRPGDTVFLFGFSRGAYTVRSLGATLGLCGVPPGLPKLERWDELRGRDGRQRPRHRQGGGHAGLSGARRGPCGRGPPRPSGDRHGSQELPPTISSASGTR